MKEALLNIVARLKVNTQFFPHLAFPLFELPPTMILGEEKKEKRKKPVCQWAAAHTRARARAHFFALCAGWSTYESGF